MNRTLARFAFYSVIVVLLIWTASLTYSFLNTALPNAFWALPIFGLVIFDGGMVAWLVVFLGHAEGSIQRATAISLTLFDFIGVSLMIVAEVLLGGQTLTAAPETLGQYAIWGIAIWTMGNVLGVLVFHLGDSNARREMAIQTEKDAIFEAALDNLKNRRTQMQGQLSAEMGQAMMEQLMADIRADADGNGVPDIYERGVQNVRSNTTQAPQPSANGVGGAGNGRGSTRDFQQRP